MKDSRDRITEAASRLFLERGYDSTTMTDIVAASGMSKGAVYIHFRHKEALHRAAIETFVLRFLEMDTPTGAEPVDVDSLVRRLCLG